MRRSENSFDFIRFCAASAVLFSHHYALSGFSEPLVPGYGEDFGKLGVEVFFCLSGFLICSSLQKTKDWSMFISARVLRIFPNLTFALAMTSIVTFVWYGNYANLWLHAKYVIKNILMFVYGVSYTIPGIFTDARNPVLNGPLWSLPSELWLYALLFCLFIIGGRRIGALIVAGAFVFSVIWGLTPVIGDFTIRPLPLDGFQFSRLGSFFFCGAVLAFFWSYLESQALKLGVAALLLIVPVCHLLPANTIFHSLILAGAVIGLGTSKAMAWFSKAGDASYGMYIFAWPCSQFSLLLIAPFWLSMVVAFLTTTAIGYTTWHTFEKQAIEHRRLFAAFIRKKVFSVKQVQLEADS